MSDHYVPPPPPYELSLQRDQKISEELQLLELSAKPPIPDEDEGQEESKDSKTLAQEAFVEALVQPLRIQKRSGAPNSSLRGPRPLPPSPADSHTRSLQRAQNGRRFSPLRESREEQYAEDSISRAPPPFTPLGSSLDGPPYGQTFSHRSTSAAPSPLSSPLQPSLDSPRHRHNNQRPQASCSPTQPRAEPSSRRVSHGVLRGTSTPATPQNKGFGTRLAFDPSVAYVNSNTDQWGAIVGPRTVNAASLYSSAVSSHLDPSSALNHASRHPYIEFTNRHSTYARPSTSSTEDMPISPSSSQSHSSLSSGFSLPSPSLPSPSRSQIGSGYHHLRWATSESEITRDLYRG